MIEDRVEICFNSPRKQRQGENFGNSGRSTSRPLLRDAQWSRSNNAQLRKLSWLLSNEPRFRRTTVPLIHVFNYCEWRPWCWWDQVMWGFERIQYCGALGGDWFGQFRHLLVWYIIFGKAERSELKRILIIRIGSEFDYSSFFSCFQLHRICPNFSILEEIFDKF